MLYKTPFLYDAARIRAEDAGLAVLGWHHAAMPAGASLRDHYGNPITAGRAWIGDASLGAAGVGSVDCSYAVLVQSIHNTATPDLGTVLAEIRRCLKRVRDWPNRTDYVETMLPYAGGIDPQTIANEWTVSLDCAMRAQRNLPEDLLVWLLALDCADY